MKENIGRIDFQDLPDGLKKTSRNANFLMHDNGWNAEKRLFIFSTEFNLSTLEKCTSIQIDGTFKSVPRGFYRLVSIFGYIYGK